jgi:hypothetical protein
VIRVYDFDGDDFITFDIAGWRGLSGAARRQFRRDTMWRAARDCGRVHCDGGETPCTCRPCIAEASS